MPPNSLLASSKYCYQFAADIGNRKLVLRILKLINEPISERDTKPAITILSSELSQLLMWIIVYRCTHTHLNIYLDTWSGFEAAIRLLHGRVDDSTTLVNSLSPQMSWSRMMLLYIYQSHIKPSEWNSNNIIVKKLRFYWICEKLRAYKLQRKQQTFISEHEITENTTNWSHQYMWSRDPLTCNSVLG